MSSLCKNRSLIRTRLRRRAQFLALLLGTLPVASNAFGQSYWASTNGGLWAATNVWSTDATSPPGTSFIGPSVLPSLTQAAIFNTNGNNNTQTVSLNGNREALGITMQSTGVITLRANSAGTTVRNLTIGSGGITVNAGAGSTQASPTFSISMSTASGQSNTLLFESQTWTNNSNLPIDWNSRLVGHESTTLVKSGTGGLILRGANQGQAQTINGTLSTGMRGKVIVAAGTLTVANANALGIADALTTEMSSGALNLVSDTTIQNGAVYQVANTAVATEFVTFQGSGIGGAGAIVNNATNSGITGNNLAQVRMSGDATVGGSSRFDFRTNIEQGGRFFQDGFTLTKTGASTVGIVNSLMIGGGNINIAQGELRFEQTSTLTGSGTVTVQSGATIGFNTITGSITRPIVLQGGQISHVSNDFVSSINSDITVASGPATFNVVDNNNATVQGKLNLLGTVTSSSNLIKTGSGRLGVTLDPSSFTGSAINILGGTVDLETTGAGITAAINVANTTTGATIFRPGIGGEGKTSGTLTFGTTNENGSNRIWFDGSSTGAGQHLRVGNVNTNSNQVDTFLIKPAPAGTGIVVFESETAGSISSSDYRFLGRGTLSANGTGTQLLLDYAPASLVWRGNDGTNPTYFDLQSTANWVNGTDPDTFFDGDMVVFNDTVGNGSKEIVPIDSVQPGGVLFNNNTANYRIVGTSNGVISAGQVTLTKSGTGVTTIEHAPGVQANVFGNTVINSGLLALTYNNPGNTVTTGAVTPTLGNQGSVTINGGTLRSQINVANSGFGGNPVLVNSNGTLEFIRGPIPNGTNLLPSNAATLTNPLSGSGDIIFTGVQEPFGTVNPQVTNLNSFGAYTLNGDGQNFSGRMILNNSRLNVDNQFGVDEIGTATVVVNEGSQMLLNAAATIPFEGNTFSIAGSGWTYDPIAADGGSGALRFNTGSVVGASSTVLIAANNARINAQQQTGRINGVITDGPNTFALEIGNPTATQNGNLVLAGSNTYGGGTNIANHLVMANNDGAFGTGQVNINGVTSARNTNISIGNGITINNPITMTSAAGLGGSRGAIEGGRTLQVTDLNAGVGTVAGSVAIPGSLVNNWAHFSAGEGVESRLRVTGQVTSANGYVQVRSQNVGGAVELANSTNQITRLDLTLGTLRLGANNAIGDGAELVTRRAADANGASGVFDMNGFDQTVSAVTRFGAVAGSNFSLLNTGTSPSTLTINGSIDSNIQNIPLGPGVVNIVKNGTGALLLSGTTAGLTGVGSYQINAGTFEVAAGQVAAGSLTLSNGASVVGTGSVGSMVLNGGTVSPGSSPGTFGVAGNVAIVGTGNSFDWEIVQAFGGVAGALPGGITGTPGTDYDQVTVNGTLDLSNLGSMTINVIGLAGLPATQGVVGAIDPLSTLDDFDQNLNYSWMLYDTTSAILGFDVADFSINTASFVNNNPASGSFTVGLANNGTDLVLNYTAVPEPTTLALVMLGLGAASLRRRRSRSIGDDQS